MHSFAKKLSAPGALPCRAFGAHPHPERLVLRGGNLCHRCAPTDFFQPRTQLPSLCWQHSHQPHPHTATTIQGCFVQQCGSAVGTATGGAFASLQGTATLAPEHRACRHAGVPCAAPWQGPPVHACHTRAHTQIQKHRTHTHAHTCGRNTPPQGCGPTPPASADSATSTAHAGARCCAGINRCKEHTATLHCPTGEWLQV